MASQTPPFNQRISRFKTRVLLSCIILCYPCGFSSFVLLCHHEYHHIEAETKWPLFRRRHFEWKSWISLKISLKIVPMVRISNIPALVRIMAWCRPGDKPLSESMMISLPTHICVTRPQWVHHFILSLQAISMWELHNDYATGQTVGGHRAIGWRLL